MEKTTTGNKQFRKQSQTFSAAKNLSFDSLIDIDLVMSLFAFSNDEIILTDSDFNILARNFKIFTQKSDNVRNFMTLLEKRKLLEEQLFIEKYANSKAQKTALRLVLPEGKYIKVQMAKRFQNNIISGYMIVMNDYTEEIMRLREKEYFTDTLMHDLKTPARAEENALELLCDGVLGELNDEQKQMLKEILNSSRYMVRMTDNVLAKLKLETEGLVLKKEFNSIKKTIEACVNDIKYMLESAKQTIKINLQTGEEMFFYDESTISLVLKNLLTNASEYSPEGSTIYVTVKNNAQNIIIVIKDEGQGISHEKLEALLNNPQVYNKRFKRVSAGLGLFVTEKILQAHNGSIEINKNIDKGSEFIIKIPYQKTLVSDSCADIK